MEEEKSQFNTPGIPTEILVKAKVKAIRQRKTLAQVVRQFIVSYASDDVGQEAKMEWGNLENS
jgi:hypothetical protein